MILKFREVVNHWGAWGAVAMCGAFLLWVLCMLPTTGFELMLGFTYGVGWGFAVSLIAKSTGSIIMFLVARRFLKERATNMVAKHRVLNRLHAAAGANGFKVALMVRLAYIPLAVKNIGLSAFPISILSYCVVTVMVNAPVYLPFPRSGTLIRRFMDVFPPLNPVPSVYPLFFALARCKTQQEWPLKKKRQGRLLLPVSAWERNRWKHQQDTSEEKKAGGRSGLDVEEVWGCCLYQVKEWSDGDPMPAMSKRLLGGLWTHYSNTR